VTQDKSVFIIFVLCRGLFSMILYASVIE